MTPSTGRMRDIYATYVAPHINDSSEELFDRWLNSIKAEAWDEGAVFGVRDQHGTVDTYIRDAIERHNPYRLAGKDE